MSLRTFDTASAGTCARLPRILICSPILPVMAASAGSTESSQARVRT
jgi:hypothetical protein